MSKTDNPRKVLGKGLNALLSTRTQAPAPPPAVDPVQPGESALYVPIDSIDPNPLQPRRVFEPDRLAELAQSIRANGIVQPLVVRRSGDRYQLVAGERRWRAARIAELVQVPVVVRDIPDERLLEITLIENIQREDLNPIETALAYDRLGRELGMNAEELGNRTGKDRSTVLNLQRLLQLPPDIQQLVGERQLTAGHARCILTLAHADQQRELAQKAVNLRWSVRQTELAASRITTGKAKPDEEEADLDANTKDAQLRMQMYLGTKVKIVEKPKQNGGRIEIDYFTPDELMRLFDMIVKDRDSTT